MAISKVERLMNLVIALLSTRQYLTAERIRGSVAGYEESASDEAFSRMFERDKNELRELGVPLETGRVSRTSSQEGYRINPQVYALPDIDLTRDEAAAVAIAVQLWESPELTTASHGALVKLRAAGVELDADPSTVIPVTTLGERGRGSEDVLRVLLSAIAAGQAVKFPHRSGQTAPWVTRTVDPWAVITERGRWYLVGHDHDRDEPRTFRISRIGSPVEPFGPVGVVTRPPEVDVRATVTRSAGDSDREVSGQARVWIAQGRGHDVRRLAAHSEPAELGGRAGDIVTIDVRSWLWITRVIAGYGADAVALEPPELRDSVLARLRPAAGVAP